MQRYNIPIPAIHGYIKKRVWRMNHYKVNSIREHGVGGLSYYILWGIQSSKKCYKKFLKLHSASKDGLFMTIDIEVRMQT